MSQIEVGAAAPDFSAITSDGQRIRLSDFRGEKAVVIFFYPKNNTPICTQEACSFRDNYDHFVKLDAVVIGVSGDSAESHRSFAAKQRLPYLMISDEDNALRRMFGVPKSLLILPGRVTYVIDRQGIVQNIFSSQLLGARHVAEALKSLKQLQDPE